MGLFWAIATTVAALVFILGAIVLQGIKLTELTELKEKNEQQKEILKAQMELHLNHGGSPTYQSGTMEELTKESLEQYQKSSEDGGS